jgi:hypothetical protein
MATPTKIVVHFDDGTTTEIPIGGMSSVFLNESAAVGCGHRPPYKQGAPPSKRGGAGSGTVAAMSEGESCYYVNGVIVCP